MTTETFKPSSMPAFFAELEHVEDSTSRVKAQVKAQAIPVGGQAIVPTRAGNNGRVAAAPSIAHEPPQRSDSVAAAAGDLADDFRAALTVGIAQGMLIQCCGLTTDQAYEVMRHCAHEHKLTVHGLAVRFLRAGRVSVDVQDAIAAVTKPPAGCR